MAYREIEVRLPTNYNEEELRVLVCKKLRIKSFSYKIAKKSLDARKKDNIHWLLKLNITSSNLKSGTKKVTEKKLEIPNLKTNKKVIVVGSGPAGFFSAYVLQQAGFSVTIIEQGSKVEDRTKDISKFEETGVINSKDNYAFGEGGAGTFSDGKLTSRTKTIKLERKYIFDCYIDAGAPKEISYLAFPHLGSDNLKAIVRKLREKFIELGGRILFKEKIIDLIVNNKIKQVRSILSKNREFNADYYIFATGHSARDSYKMLINRGIEFRSKPFAIGCRVEHEQRIINLAQWKKESLPGVKAAEYRLTYKSNEHLPVYSFCMCPGGKVVNASFDNSTNLVNGMSNYQRNSKYGNSAIVVATDLSKMIKPTITPLESLDWVYALEQKYFEINNNLNAPANRISDFIDNKISNNLPDSSYDFDLYSADFKTLLPKPIVTALQFGLTDFCNKLDGFDSGIMLGLESKVSSPIQAIREQNGKSISADNLYIVGEGSGYAGGIISSGADGIKAAMEIIDFNK